MEAAESLYGTPASAIVGAAWDGVGVTKTHPDAHGDTLDRAALYRYGDTVSGAINWAGDVDCFAFTPASNGTYEFFTSGGTDTLGVIMDASGEVIAADDNGKDGHNF